MNMFKRVLKSNFTGAAAIAVALDIPGGHYELKSMTAHFSADPGVENLTVTLDTNAGAVYDMNLLTQAMSGVTDLLWQPDGIILEAGDQIEIAMTNASTRTYGIQITLVEV